MDTEFLHCCICPRQPDFSDTSHLLTHVSSKGHLSHLHKLQVRSHQEIAAGYQLTIYNDWYLKYSVAQLLSERMQHKQNKQAWKRVTKQRRRKSTDEEPDSKVDPNLLTTNSEGFMEQVCSSQHYSSISSITPGQDLVAEHQSGCQPYGLTENKDARPAPPTPEVAKLKGIIWPGMDIFDSADQETQRKRNQRKDVSILGRMQAMSTLIEPVESVLSPGGTFKKKRHIDDIEDDSPVEGEHPLVNPSSRRRKPLATVDKNVARFDRGGVKRRGNQRAYATPARRMGRKTRPSLCQQSVTGEFWRHDSDSDYHWGDFATFSDTSSDVGNASSTALLPNPFLESARSHTQPAPLSFLGPFWSQLSPQNDTYNDFYRDQRMTPLLYAESNVDKENVNPLRWAKTSRTTIADSLPTALGVCDEYDGGIGPLAEVYAFTRNPLAGATPDQKQLPATPRNSLLNRS